MTWIAGEGRAWVQLAFGAEFEALLLCVDRRHRLDAEITVMAGEQPWARWCAGWGVCEGCRR